MRVSLVWSTQLIDMREILTVYQPTSIYVSPISSPAARNQLINCANAT